MSQTGDAAPSRAPSSYPYTTHLNVLFPPLETIDVNALARTVRDEWYNQTLCRVNDSVVRLGVLHGEYHWHKHDDDDEFFFVLSGQLLIDLDPRVDQSPGRVIALDPHQGFAVPKTVVHGTRAPERTIVLMMETAAIVPTGS